MDGFQTFTTVALFTTMIITMQNLIRYARAGDGNGILGIVLAFVGGCGVALWGAHADVTAGIHLIQNAPALGDLDGGSLAMLGLAIGSLAPVAVDVIKARDNQDSAAKPKLLEGGQGQGGAA